MGALSLFSERRTLIAAWFCAQRKRPQEGQPEAVPREKAVHGHIMGI
jgi:hypothetical protein